MKAPCSRSPSSRRGAGKATAAGACFFPATSVQGESSGEPGDFLLMTSLKQQPPQSVAQLHPALATLVESSHGLGRLLCPRNGGRGGSWPCPCPVRDLPRRGPGKLSGTSGSENDTGVIQVEGKEEARAQGPLHKRPQCVSEGRVAWGPSLVWFSSIWGAPGSSGLCCPPPRPRWFNPPAPRHLRREDGDL